MSKILFLLIRKKKVILSNTSYNHTLRSSHRVILLTKNIASDYGSYNIRANSICPGYIETPMFDGAERYLGVDVTESIRKQHKLQRFGKPEEIASVVKFLASDESSFVSGVALPVDGGFTAGHNHGE